MRPVRGLERVSFTNKTMLSMQIASVNLLSLEGL